MGRPQSRALSMGEEQGHEPAVRAWALSWQLWERPQEGEDPEHSGRVLLCRQRPPPRPGLSKGP